MADFSPQCATHAKYLLFFISEQNLAGVCSTRSCNTILFLLRNAQNLSLGPVMQKHDIIHKTGSIQHRTTPPKDDRATATGNIHRKYGEFPRCEICKHTNNHNTLNPLDLRVTWVCIHNLTWH